MPTTKPRLSINLPESEFAELAAIADKYNISMAWIGRQALLEFLDRYREKSDQLPLTFSEHHNVPNVYPKS